MAAPTVTVGSSTDSAVVGKAYLNNCIQVSISNGCTFTIGGHSTASFNETTKTVGGVNYQELSLSGCLGALTSGQAFTFNAVFNIQSTDGLINIMP